MIKNYSGKKCTPKEMAARIMKNNIDSASYWQEQEDLNELTDREIALIDKQVSNFQKRMDKMLDKIIYKNKD